MWGHQWQAVIFPQVSTDGFWLCITADEKYAIQIPTFSLLIWHYVLADILLSSLLAWMYINAVQGKTFCFLNVNDLQQSISNFLPLFCHSLCQIHAHVLRYGWRMFQRSISKSYYRVSITCQAPEYLEEKCIFHWTRYSTWITLLTFNASATYLHIIVIAQKGTKSEHKKTKVQ